MGLGVYSDSYKNEYQESIWGVKSGRRVELTIILYLPADFLEDLGASTFHNPMGLHGLLHG
jgi:hypothetical protein